MKRSAVRLLTVVLLVALYTTGQDQNKAVVSVEVVTEAGETIPNPSLFLLRNGASVPVAQFLDGRAQQIPFGEYTLHVREPGFKQFEHRIAVYSPEVYAKLLLRVANLPVRPAKVTGFINATPDEWIKLVPILNTGDPLFETKPKADGTFELDGINGGDYLLIVIRDSRVIWTQQLAIRAETRIEIKLPPVK